MDGLPVVANEFNIVPGMAGFDTIHTYGVPIGCIACLASIKIVHWKRCIAGYLVQTLATEYCLLNLILIIENFIAPNDWLHTAGQA